MCCAKVAMYKENSSKVSYIKTCMDSAVADVNVGMWIDDFYMTIECDQDNKWGYRSKAMMGVATSTTTLTAVLLLTFNLI